MEEGMQQQVINKCKPTAKVISIMDMTILIVNLIVSIIFIVDFPKIKENQPYKMQFFVNASEFASAEKKKDKLGKYLVSLVLTNVGVTVLQFVAALALYKSTTFAKTIKEPVFAFQLTLFWFIISMFSLQSYIIWSSVEGMWLVPALVLIIRGSFIGVICIYLWETKKALMAVKDELVAKGILKFRNNRRSCCK